MTDCLPALRTHLAADAGIAAEVSTRIYDVDMPNTEVRNQPRKAIVLRHSGGPADSGYLAFARERYDIFHYGATPLQARAVRNAVYAAMKDIEREVVGGVLIHSADMSSGPVDLRLPETDWPVVIETWLVKFSEVAAA